MAFVKVDKLPMPAHGAGGLSFCKAPKLRNISKFRKGSVHYITFLGLRCNSYFWGEPPECEDEAE